jgi:hypothetical protein
MTKSGYFPSRTTMDVNTCTTVHPPGRIFERGTEKTIIGQYPEKSLQEGAHPRTKMYSSTSTSTVGSVVGSGVEIHDAFH